MTAVSRMAGKSSSKKLANLENLSATVMMLHGEDYSVREIKERLFPLPYPIVAFSEKEWDSQHVVTSILKILIPNIN